MRLNKWIALYAPYSRRKADELIAGKRVSVNGNPAQVGQDVTEKDIVTIDGNTVAATKKRSVVVLLHKPVGYVCSRNGQGAPTIYELLPTSYHHLDIAGRLDKDSSGLVVLTNDGELAHSLTHPSFIKQKRYEVTLATPLIVADKKAIEQGIPVENYTSKLQLTSLSSDGLKWEVLMHEGRNRQIRRTFETLGYTVSRLHRTRIGSYDLGDIGVSQYVQYE